jgi:TM2 domain-containing membrane protein YozV
MVSEISPKSRLVVTLLAWFLGVFGAHRFYLGKTGTALLMLFTLGGLGIWALVDFILAVAGVMEDKDGRVNRETGYI